MAKLTKPGYMNSPQSEQSLAAMTSVIPATYFTPETMTYPGQRTYPLDDNPSSKAADAVTTLKCIQAHIHPIQQYFAKAFEEITIIAGSNRVYYSKPHLPTLIHNNTVPLGFMLC